MANIPERNCSVSSFRGFTFDRGGVGRKGGWGRAHQSITWPGGTEEEEELGGGAAAKNSSQGSVCPVKLLRLSQLHKRVPPAGDQTVNVIKH